MPDDFQPNGILANLTDEEKLQLFGDVAKSAGIGLAKAGTDVAGLPGELSEYGARGLDRATRYLGGLFGVAVPQRQDQATPSYGPADIQKTIEGYTGNFYQPRTETGRKVQDLSQLAADQAAAGLIAGGMGFTAPAIARHLRPMVQRMRGFTE